MNDKQRAELERWAEDKYILERSKSGDYMSVPTKRAFECWQAAIATVVVEIPSFFSERYETDIIYSDDMEKALESAGVRYE